jgi:hypothetical protein
MQVQLPEGSKESTCKFTGCRGMRSLAMDTMERLRCLFVSGNPPIQILPEGISNTGPIKLTEEVLIQFNRETRCELNENDEKDVTRVNTASSINSDSTFSYYNRRVYNRDEGMFFKKNPEESPFYSLFTSPISKKSAEKLAPIVQVLTFELTVPVPGPPEFIDLFGVNGPMHDHLDSMM